MNEDFSEARKSIVSATSEGLPILISGVSSHKAESVSSLCILFISVSMTPGQRQFTLTPDSPTSFARAFVNPMREAFAEEYATSQEAPTFPHIEEIFMILPYFLFCYGQIKAMHLQI